MFLTPTMELEDAVRAAKITSRVLAKMSTEEKNAILGLVAEELERSESDILKANAQDIETAIATASAKGITKNTDRLFLNHDRLQGMIAEVRNVMTLEDYVGKIIDERERPNGLKLQRVRVPLGVILMIYEARPNVTIDSAVLALKSGNAVILKGGSEAIHTNRALAAVLQRALLKGGIHESAVTFIDAGEASHKMVEALLQMKDMIDVVIPRGGKGLIDMVVEKSRIPVIETGASVVHAYIDEFADPQKAIDIVVNSKTRRVTVCNALDVLLVHSSIAQTFIPELEKTLAASSALRAHPPVHITYDPKDYDTEFLDYTLAIKIVDSLDEAITHITEHSFRHSECIVTEREANAERFLNEIDAACVYWNTSTQFSDGAQFGLGAEIGISTQKLHVRGPFALEGLTTYKWKIRGNGQIRPA